MARKTKEEAERTYHLLLDAAIDEFIERGVAHTTLLQIATRAGLTRGAIYWHFKNKEELIMALWQYKTGEDHKMFCQEMRNIGPEQGAEQFRTLMEMMVAQLGLDPSMRQTLHIISTVMEYADPNSEISLYMYARSEEVHSSITTAIETLQDHGIIKIKIPAEIMASGAFAYFVGLADVCMMNSCNKNHSVDVGQHAKELVDLMLSGWF